MEERLFGSLILSLVDIMQGTQVHTESVSKALALICKEYDFDCGLVYELNFTEQFSLKERFPAQAEAFCPSFAIDEWSAEEQRHLAHEPVSFIESSTQNTAMEKRLLDSINAAVLVFAPVVDESWRIYGLVVLTGNSVPSSVRGGGMAELRAALSLLVRYVSARMYHSKLVQAQTSLESILDNTGIDIYVNDFYNHDILYVNKSMAAPYGGREKFLNQKCWRILFPGQTGPCDFCPQKELVDEEGNPTKVYSWDYQRPFDGSWFRVFSAAFQWMDGRMAHVVSSANITDNKRNEALVEYMASYDQLTKLPNRRMLVRDCERRIEGATSTERGYLLFVDIDGFKAINDTYGHDAGDEFLILLSEFLSGIPLLKDAIYRNGGDEFVGIIGGETITRDNIESLGRFICKRFEKPWCLKKGQVFCNISIGVACFPMDGSAVETLLQKADEAMYRVKKSGGGGLAFSNSQ